MRPSGRQLNELRPVSIELGVMKHAEGSWPDQGGQHACLVYCHHRGQSAAVPERNRIGLDYSGVWYAAPRNAQPHAPGSRCWQAVWKNTGNSETYWPFPARGIGQICFGERQIVVDCDVIQADGGTRCASITGGWVALRLAVNQLLKSGAISSDAILDHVAAVSCGIYAGQEILDLDYPEDSAAGTDGNFVLTGRGKLIEVQMSAEGSAFSRAEMTNLLDLAEVGISTLVQAQKSALGG